MLAPVAIAVALICSFGVFAFLALHWSFPRILGTLGGMSALMAICFRYVVRLRWPGASGASRSPHLGSSSPTASRERAPRYSRDDFERMCPAAPLEADAEVGGEPDLCCVCLNAKVEGDLCRRLHCGHCYHADCIDDWWSRGDANELVCPLCRRPSDVVEVSV